MEIQEQILQFIPDSEASKEMPVERGRRSNEISERERIFFRASQKAILTHYSDRLPADQLDQIRSAETDEELKEATQRAWWKIGRSVEFEIIESFAGEVPERVSVTTGFGGGDCGYGFREGETYLVEAYRNEVGAWSAWVCSSRVSSIAHATQDLAVLRAWKRSEPIGPQVYGRLEDWTTRQDSHKRYPPAARVELSLVGGEEPVKVVTDENGQFIFSSLDKREYQLELGLPGWSFTSTSENKRSIDLTAGGCAELFLTIEEHQGTIRGRIRPQPGEELPEHLWIEAVPVDPERPHPFDGTARAPDGEFDIDEIEPGEYYVGINVQNAPSGPHHSKAEFGRVWPYPETYYPGVTDPRRAAVFRVDRGQTVTLEDWVLPQRLSERHVQGVVLRPDGTPAADARVILRVPGRTGFDVIVGKAGPTSEDGAFEVWPLEGLDYEMEAALFEQSTRRLFKVKTDLPSTLQGPVTLVLNQVEGEPSKSDRVFFNSFRWERSIPPPDALPQ